MAFKLKVWGAAGAIAMAAAIVALCVAPGKAATMPEPDLRSGLPLAARPVMELAQVDPLASTLPGGASALTETYQDWQVACSQQEAGKRCALSQNQVQQNGQRVLAIELGAPTENAVSGVVVLPFGLSLAAGAVLQIDDRPAAEALPFRTCLPVGCVVPVTFDLDTVALLRAGVTLKVITTSDAGQQTPFTVSLKGFVAALDRVAALAR